jgi:hypothetical protein
MPTEEQLPSGRRLHGVILVTVTYLTKDRILQYKERGQMS